MIFILTNKKGPAGAAGSNGNPGTGLQVVTFTTGASTWLYPSNAVNARYYICGAGGGGGYGGAGTTNSGGGGGSGGSGALMFTGQIPSSLQGVTFYISQGAAGAPAVAGGSSSISYSIFTSGALANTSLVISNGAPAGANGTSNGNGGNGGAGPAGDYPGGGGGAGAATNATGNNNAVVISIFNVVKKLINYFFRYFWRSWLWNLFKHSRRCCNCQLNWWCWR